MQNQKLRSELQRCEERVASATKVSLEGEILTPRPKWEKVAEKVPKLDLDAISTSEEKLRAIVEFWQSEVAKARSETAKIAMGHAVSNWMSDVDVCPGDFERRYVYIIPRGTAGSVPKCLRHGDLIRNRHFQQSDIQQIVVPYLNFRMQSLTSAPQQSFEDSWIEWSTKQTGSEIAAIELTYNVLHGCLPLLGVDPYAAVFHHCLFGELSDLLLIEMRDTIAELIAACEQCCLRSSITCVTKTNFFRCLKRIFPEKSVDHVAKIRLVVALWTNDAEVIDFRKLFGKSLEGRSSSFVRLLRLQFLREALMLNLQISEKLRNLIPLEGGRIAVHSAIAAMKEIDPVWSDVYLTAVFSQCCRVTVPDLVADMSLSMDGETLLQRIRLNVFVRRASPPQDFDDTFSVFTDNAEMSDAKLIVSELPSFK
jgi:hypothetical protein